MSQSKKANDDFVIVHKTSADDIWTRPLSNRKGFKKSGLSKTESAKMLVSLSMAMHYKLSFGLMNPEKRIQNLKTLMSSHISMALNLANLSPGNSSNVVKRQAELCLEHLDTGKSDPNDNYSRLVDNIHCGKKGFLQITFEDSLKGTSIYSDGTSLHDYVTSEEGLNLLDRSVASNVVANLVYHCSPPISDPYFKMSAGGAWMASEFGGFGDFFLGGSPNFNIDMSAASLATSIVGNSRLSPCSTIVLVGDTPLSASGTGSLASERVLDNGCRIVHLDVDDRNAPMCANVIRNRYPDSAVVVGEGIRLGPFTGLDPIRSSKDLDLDMICRYGPFYKDAQRAFDLVELHRMCWDDPLDDIIVQEIERMTGIKGMRD